MKKNIYFIVLCVAKYLYIHFNINTTAYAKYLSWRYSIIAEIVDYCNCDFPDKIYTGTLDCEMLGYWLQHKEPNALLKRYANL